MNRVRTLTYGGEMKKFIVVLGILFLIVSCGSDNGGNKTIDASKLENRDGIAYEANQEKPYTGKVVKISKVEINYKDGKPNGQMIAWYGNGQKRYETTHKDGKRIGKWITWYENGQKRNEATFKDGKENGKSIAWHENGQKRVEGTYKSGKKNGKWIEWDENGQKSSEKIYKDGKQIKE